MKNHLLFCTLLVGASCANADFLDSDRAAPLAVIPVSEVGNNLSVQFGAQAREITVTFRLDAEIPRSTSASISFPPALFDGFQDAGVKSFFGAAGLYTESITRGAPFLIRSNTEGFFNLPRAAEIRVSGGTMTVTATGSPLPSIPAGLYTMNFLPGVFKLNPGAHDVSATITWAGGERLTLNKLLLINGQIVPHFGTGTLGNITITTQLVINNPNGEAINVTAQFFNPSGAPLNVRVGTTTATQHTFNIAAKSSRFVELDPSGVVPPQTGWVLMTTNAANPFQAAVLFSNENRIGSAITAPLETPLVSGSRLRTEAGIAAAVLDTRHVLQVGNTNDGLSTAFAVANPTAKSANAALTFRSDDGQTTRQRSLTLPAKNQTAQFFTDFFNLSSGQALSGTLTIISDTDLAVMALRTLNGEQTASLPSGTSGP